MQPVLCSLITAHDVTQVLELIEDKAIAVEICESLRPGLSDLSTVIFIIQFELRSLSSSLSMESRYELERISMGAQVCNSDVVGNNKEMAWLIQQLLLTTNRLVNVYRPIAYYISEPI